MIITICGSITFVNEMRSIGLLLDKKGHTVQYPDLSQAARKSSKEEHVKRKRRMDLIRAHFEKISRGDAILVVNFEKNGVKGWIGANTFWEIGFAHVLGKKIFLMEPPPTFDYFADEIKAIDFKVLDGDLDRIS